MSSVPLNRGLLSQIPSRRKVANTIFGVVCLCAASVGIVLLAILLHRVVTQGVGVIDKDFLTSFASSSPDRSGIRSAITGSLWVMGLTAVFTIPVAVAAAIYLEEFTRKKNRFVELIEIAISNLAGVPSIVYGILGLTVFVRWMMLDRSIISGALTMSLLILPMLITVTQEALRAVPSSYREASFGLGATEWQTIWRQVLPNAAGGILTGIILAISRAIGETAPLIVIGAASFVRFDPKDLHSRFTVLPIQIFNWISQPNAKFQDLAGGAILVLLVVLLSLNSLAIFLRIRTQRKAR